MGHFQPKHLFVVLSPTLYASIITGTCIFHLKKQGANYSLEITQAGKNLALARLCFYTIFFIHAMLTPSNLQIIDYYDSTLENLGVCFELIIGTLLVFVIYISSFKSGVPTKIMLTEFLKIDAILMQFNGDLKYRETYFYQFYYLFFGLVAYFVISFCQYTNAKSVSLIQISISLHIIIYFPMFLALIMELQFICITNLLKYRFKYINKEITQICITKIFFTNSSLELPSKRKDIASMDISQKLDTLIYLYDKLLDTVNVVNRHFGLQLLFSIGIKFILTVFSLYYSYWSKVVKLRTWSSIIWGMWAVYHLSLLLHISVCCQLVSTEAKHTAVCIHKLLLNVRNTVLKEKLMTFSLQLLHRPVCFTALGLFAIDATLYSSIFAAGSTYLIIMLQFEEAMESDKAKNFISLNKTHILQI